MVITDRNDLDNQLYGQFSRCRDFLRQTPQQAESRQHLQELLAGRQANGIIFTTMQKFEETGEPLSERRPKRLLLPGRRCGEAAVLSGMPRRLRRTQDAAMDCVSDRGLRGLRLSEPAI